MRFIALLVIILGCMAIPTVLIAQGCMGGDDEEGVQVKGFFQPQIEYGMYGEDNEELAFTFNRARFGLVGSIPYDVSYYFFLEASPFKTGTPYVLDAFITYSRLEPYLTVSIGQFKSPYSMELNTSCAGLHTIRRSLAVTNLAAPGRDVGIMLLGNYQEYVRYSFALMNGTGKGVWDNNMGKDIAGRIVITPIKPVSLGGSFRMGKSAPATVGAEDEDEMTRFAGELQLEYAGFMVQGEYLLGENIGSIPITGGCGDIIGYEQGTAKSGGMFVQGMYLTPWNIQPVVKYESYDPDTDTDDNLQQIITFGFNYFLNDWTRIQMNYLYKAEEGNEIENDELLVQFQVQF